MKICFQLLFWILLCSLAGPVLAKATVEDPKKTQLASLQERINKLNSALTESHKEQSNLSKALHDTEVGIISTSKNLKKIKEQTDTQQKRLAELQDQQQLAENDLYQAQSALTQQLKRAYLLPKQETLKLLLNQQDASNLGRMMIYYSYFNRSRIQQIEQIRQKINYLINSQELVKHTSEHLKMLQQTQQTEMSHLVKQKSNRQYIIERLNEQIQNRTAELNTLRQNKANLEQVIIRLQKEQKAIAQKQHHAIKQAKKQLSWPTRGMVTRRFGQPIEQSDLTWNGVLIKAPEGQNVYSVFPGKVIFADWLKGFGMLVIIDHGDGYMSLYGRNSEIFKQVGDAVTQKELIAAVGQSGGYSESGLYFELRHNGRPVNPENWFSSKQSSNSA